MKGTRYAQVQVQKKNSGSGARLARGRLPIDIHNTLALYYGTATEVAS